MNDTKTPREIDVNAKIDNIIAQGLEHQALSPFAVKLLDTVLRPYIHAFDWAQDQAVPPPEALRDMANLQASALAEMLVRIVGRTNVAAAEAIAQEYVDDFSAQLEHAMDANFGRMH